MIPFQSYTYPDQKNIGITLLFNLEVFTSFPSERETILTDLILSISLESISTSIDEFSILS